MSAAQEYQVKSARFGTDPKLVYMIDEFGNRFTFPFDIHCKTQPMSTTVHFFFDLKQSKLLVLYKDPIKSSFECGVMRFFIKDDIPMPTLHWLSNMEDLVSRITPEFRDQYASYLIDQEINSL